MIKGEGSRAGWHSNFDGLDEGKKVHRLRHHNGPPGGGSPGSGYTLAVAKVWDKYSPLGSHPVNDCSGSIFIYDLPAL